MIKLSKQSSIYILCPANIATGGPESIHVLCEALIKRGHNAKIVYLNEAYPGGGGHPGHGWVDRSEMWRGYISAEGKHPDYEKYKTKSTAEITDHQDNLLIAPEIFLNAINDYSEIQKAIWWLASRMDDDGYYKEDQWFHTDDSVHHFHNSQAAEMMFKMYQDQFPQDSCYQLETYVNLDFDKLPEKKENYIAYNPKKGMEFTQKVIEEWGDQAVFVPIVNMTRDQVKRTLDKAKVYIDFGHHPGRERMPREAVLSGCCVIVGFRGSAKWHRDVPIGRKYKFITGATNFAPTVCDVIKQCFSDYPKTSQDFDHYRRVLKANPAQFELDVDKIFGYV
jgi:hypothetical protein